MVGWLAKLVSGRVVGKTITVCLCGLVGWLHMFNAESSAKLTACLRGLVAWLVKHA